MAKFIKSLLFEKIKTSLTGRWIFLPCLYPWSEILKFWMNSSHMTWRGPNKVWVAEIWFHLLTREDWSWKSMLLMLENWAPPGMLQNSVNDGTTYGWRRAVRWDDQPLEDIVETCQNLQMTWIIQSADMWRWAWISIHSDSNISFSFLKLKSWCGRWQNVLRLFFWYLPTDWKLQPRAHAPLLCCWLWRGTAGNPYVAGLQKHENVPGSSCPSTETTGGFFWMIPNHDAFNTAFSAFFCFSGMPKGLAPSPKHAYD